MLRRVSRTTLLWLSVAMSIARLSASFDAPLFAQSAAPPTSFAPNNSTTATTGSVNNNAGSSASLPSNTVPATSPSAAPTASAATTPAASTAPAAATTPATAAPSATSVPPTTTTPAAATSGNSFSGQWRSPTGESGASGNLPPSDGMSPIGGSPRVPIAKITSGTGSLPNQNGQVWREYDISPYTARVTSTNRPEQAIVDWILRETGYEAWHSSVVSILSADAKTLRVYHIPEIQAIVADVVDRFLRNEGNSQTVNVRIISVDGPSWRAKAQQILRPVAVQTQGIQAWLVAREDASLLATDLRKRMYFRELGSPQLYIAGGQSAVVAQTRPRPYTADVVMRNDVWPGFETKASQYDEGFSIEISPLGSLDGRSIDAVIKANIDQVERLQSLAVDVPSTAAPRQRTKIEVPQVSQFRMHDRFRWPVDQVLVVSLGVVPLPSTAPAASNTGLRLPDALGGGPERGEVLIFLEARNGAIAPNGLTATPGTPQPAALQPAVTAPFTTTGSAPNATLPGTTPIPQPNPGGSLFPGFSRPAILGGLPNSPTGPSRPRY